jgi:hypothetical protein
VLGNNIAGHAVGLYVTGSWNTVNGNQVADSTRRLINHGVGNVFVDNVYP